MQSKVIERPWEIDTRDLPIFILRHQKRLIFLLHLALFWLVGLSKRKIIEPSLTAFTGFPFALVLDVRSRNVLLTVTAKSNHSRQKEFDHGKSKSLTVRTNSLTKQINSEWGIFYSGISPLVLVHWPNMWWSDSKGAANQSASKVRQHQKHYEDKNDPQKNPPAF